MKNPLRITERCGVVICSANLNEPVDPKEANICLLGIEDYTTCGIWRYFTRTLEKPLNRQQLSFVESMLGALYPDDLIKGEKNDTSTHID